MLLFEDFDPSKRFYCNAEGDTPPDASGAGGGAPPPVGGEGASPPDPAASAAPEAATPPPAAKDWRDKQIDKHYATIKLQEREIDRLRTLEAENVRLRDLAAAAGRHEPPAATPPATPPSAPATDAVIAQRVEQELFNRQVKDLESKLRQDHPNDLQSVLENFGRLGLSGDALVGVMTQVLATDDPAYVLVTLGKDPAKLQDALDMTPAKRQATMIKIGMEKAATPVAPPNRPSDAPPPPSAPSQRGSAAAPSSDNIYDPALTDEQFAVIRKRQKLESEGRPWSIKGR
jgi:hypothetical protein